MNWMASKYIPFGHWVEEAGPVQVDGRRKRWTGGEAVGEWTGGMVWEKGEGGEFEIGKRKGGNWEWSCDEERASWYVPVESSQRVNGKVVFFFFFTKLNVEVNPSQFCLYYQLCRQISEPCTYRLNKSMIYMHEWSNSNHLMVIHVELEDTEIAIRRGLKSFILELILIKLYGSMGRILKDKKL